MNRARRTVIGLWAGLLGLAAVGSVGATSASNAGLFAPTVCISPLIFLVFALTPAETIVTVGTQWLTGLLGINHDSTQDRPKE